MLKTACEMGLEGVVSKRRDSRYTSDRTDAWVKMTCRQRETLQIVGFSLKDNRFDGLYVGRQDGDQLIYAAKSITALRPARSPTFVSASRHWCRRPKPTVRRSRSLMPSG
jgi:ATP-dependent DNA ligase